MARMIARGRGIKIIFSLVPLREGNILVIPQLIQYCSILRWDICTQTAKIQ